MTPEPETGLWRWHFGALVLYAVLSVAILDHGASITGNILGLHADPSIAIWFLHWWPFAISHHLDPLYTNLLWQPAGLNLAWATSMPFLALIGWPLTALGGPVLAYNILTIMAPVSGGWAAYFLCLRITREPFSAVIGGYLFGFSSYEMAQTFGHLNLDWIVFIPLLIITILRRVTGEAGRLQTTLLAALILVAQFLTSAEVFATLILFTALAWVFAIIFFPRHRHEFVGLLVDAAQAGGITIIVISPFLWAMFSKTRDVVQPAVWSKIYSADLLNFIVPTAVSAIGSGLLAPLAGRFTGFYDEQAAYLGLPLLIIIVSYFVQTYKTHVGKFLAAGFFATAIASMGAHLWIAGVFTQFPLPWWLFLHLPLVPSALPSRFAVYVSIFAAIIAALWIANASPRGRIFAILVCAVLFPTVHPVMKTPESTFFSPGRAEAFLGQNARVLILPFSITGQSSFWQQENDFGFVQTGGYLGFPPLSMQKYPAVLKIAFDESALSPAEFSSFCELTRTEYVIAEQGTSGSLLKLLHELGWVARPIDDVILFTVPKAI